MKSIISSSIILLIVSFLVIPFLSVPEIVGVTQSKFETFFSMSMLNYTNNETIAPWLSFQVAYFGGRIPTDGGWAIVGQADEHNSPEAENGIDGVIFFTKYHSNLTQIYTKVFIRRQYDIHFMAASILANGDLIITGSAIENGKEVIRGFNFASRLSLETGEIDWIKGFSVNQYPNAIAIKRTFYSKLYDTLIFAGVYHHPPEICCTPDSSFFLGALNVTNGEFIGWVSIFANTTTSGYRPLPSHEGGYLDILDSTGEFVISGYNGRPGSHGVPYGSFENSKCVLHLISPNMTLEWSTVFYDYRVDEKMNLTLYYGCSVRSQVIDEDENIVITGLFGARDVVPSRWFVAKFKRHAGKLAWIRLFNFTKVESVWDSTILLDGNILISGYSTSFVNHTVPTITILLDSSSGTLISANLLECTSYPGGIAPLGSFPLPDLGIGYAGSVAFSLENFNADAIFLGKFSFSGNSVGSCIEQKLNLSDIVFDYKPFLIVDRFDYSDSFSSPYFLNMNYTSIEIEDWLGQVEVLDATNITEIRLSCVGCAEHYFGERCGVTTCYGVYSNDTAVCNQNSWCNDFDHCACIGGWLGEFCNITSCNGVRADDIGMVCSGHGYCQSMDNCSCDENYQYHSEFTYYCSIWKCFDIFNFNESSACSGQGSCVGHNECKCPKNGNFTGIRCDDPMCFGFGSNESNVCSSHGSCVEPNLCNCTNSTYSGPDCGDFDCFGVPKSSVQCSGHGSCVDFDRCECDSGEYTGSKCERWTCWGTDNVNVDDVCGRHGSCVAKDTCFCLSGYSSSVIFGNCDVYYCGAFLWNDNQTIPNNKREGGGVCNGRGNCVSSHHCSCVDGYEGELCETWSCGYSKDSVGLVCSGSGECLAPNECECSTGFSGDRCEVNLMYYSVMIPVLTVSGLTFCCFLGFLILLVCCCCMMCVCIVFVLVFGLFLCLVCLLFGLCCMTFFVLFQRFRLKRFGKLKNIDLLLKEQEIEEDENVAHLRIDKELFEIAFDEIKLISILGEGGSNSVVYKALWKNQDVAFKCFKTRIVCSSQNDFDEFEREVRVLGSVSHPFIIRFFGACLDPPRVGILMEFCENGDLLVFVMTYLHSNNQMYPFSEKLRLATEIASSLDYLHSRSIIHRDLKLENVLVDFQEKSKLMDFGLSKIVDRMSQQKTKSIGTSLYMAPEIVLSGVYDEKCDVFSFAILLFILISEDRFPYGKDMQNVEMRVANDSSYRPKVKKLESMSYIPVESLDFLKNLMVRCWDHDVENRYTFSEITDLLTKHRAGEKVEVDSSKVTKKDASKSKNRIGGNFKMRMMLKKLYENGLKVVDGHESVGLDELLDGLDQEFLEEVVESDVTIST